MHPGRLGNLLHRWLSSRSVADTYTREQARAAADHGRLVSSDSPEPRFGATVRLWVFTTFVEKATTTTEADGSFRFTGNRFANIQISAGTDRSDRISIRLYFASEDRELAEALRLAKRG